MSLRTKIFIVGFLLVIFQIFDITTTYYILSMGSQELNPFALFLIQTLDYGGFLVLKIIVAASVLLLAYIANLKKYYHVLFAVTILYALVTINHIFYMVC